MTEVPEDLFIGILTVTIIQELDYKNILIYNECKIHVYVVYHDLSGKKLSSR